MKQTKIMNLKETPNNTNSNSNNYISNTTSTQQASSEKQSLSDHSHSSSSSFLNNSIEPAQSRVPKDSSSHNKTSILNVKNNESSSALNEKTTQVLTNEVETKQTNTQNQLQNVKHLKQLSSSSLVTLSVDTNSNSNSIGNEKEQKKSSSKANKPKSTEPINNIEKNSNQNVQIQTERTSETQQHSQLSLLPLSKTAGPVSCNCKEHKGTETLNRIFDLSFNYLYDCMFNDSAFARKYRKYKKVHSLQIGEWVPSLHSPDQKARKLDYKVDLGAIGTVKTVEDQKILYYKENECITLESETNTQGVLYTDYFSVVNRYCITRHTQHRTRLLLHTYVDYKKQPSFLVKGFIEKNAWNNLKEAFIFIQKELIKEVEPKTTSSFENRSNLYLASNAKSPIENKGSKDQSNVNESKEREKSDQIKLNTIKNRAKERPSQSKLTDSRELREFSIGKDETNDEEKEDDEIEHEDTKEQTAQQTSNRHIKLYNFAINQNTILCIIIIFILIISVLNVLLYMKLSNAEQMVHTLSALKTKKKELDLSVSMCSNCDNDKKLTFPWRELISNSLNSIKTMNSLLKEWENSLNLFKEQSDEF